jgi:benzodiazapine receptor
MSNEFGLACRLSHPSIYDEMRKAGWHSIKVVQPGNTMHRLLLAGFILGVLGIGWAIGATNMPGAWYASLQKPSFNPPNWIFAPTWTVLYVLIAVVGWRTYLRRAEGTALKAWVGQMLLNLAWSPTVFTFHSLGAGLAVILGMLLLILTFIVLQWGRDRTSALLFVPYASWVAFASLLNYSLYRLN